MALEAGGFGGSRKEKHDLDPQLRLHPAGQLSAADVAFLDERARRVH